MASFNTIFSEGDIIEGTSPEGLPYRFRVLKDGSMGSGSVFGPAFDEINNSKVFLKKYNDPGPKSPWYNAFVEYQNKIYEKIKGSATAMQLVAKIKLYFLDERRRFWQAIEFIENSRDLQDYLRSETITWEQRVKFAKVFMFAMKTLHQDVGLVHGDLKPANLLLIPQGQDYVIKLIDFDRPILLDENRIPWESEGYLGSPSYYSPEHRRGLRPVEKSDVFTCGIILYELLAKENHPFNRDDVPADYSVNNAPMPTFYGSFGSEELDQSIAKMLHDMLNPKPEDRPTAEQVHKLLNSRPTPSGGSSSKKDAASQIRDLSTSVEIPPSAGEDSVKCAADVVFLMDSTNSMRPCIDALKEHIHAFVHSLVSGSGDGEVVAVEDWRARIVGYRDFLDCNANEKVARSYKKIAKGGWFLSNSFTRDENELYNQLDALKPFGGGSDPRESLLDALMLVLKSGYLPAGQSNALNENENVAWRKKGVGRVIVIFTDAGFHSTMSYNHQKTFFDEKNLYPINLEGAGLDELQDAIESGFFRIFVYAPMLPDYEEMSDLSRVFVTAYDNGGDGLSNLVKNSSSFDKLMDDIVRGVSRCSSEYQDIDL